jgi:hypothetical protein
MTEQNDDFLQRWSRRKQAAVADTRKAQEQPAPTPAAEGDKAGAEAFDPATLPPIDSISAISDVRDFLRAGVPAELTRAALRRAWSADPAIRDFIGLAENSWDFTAPDAIPGFGPLNASPEEIRQLVDQIMSRTSDVADASLGAPTEVAKSQPEQGVQPQVRDEEAPATAAALDNQSDQPTGQLTDARPINVALQQDEPEPPPRPRRSRGGALPR